MVKVLMVETLTATFGVAMILSMLVRSGTEDKFSIRWLFMLIGPLFGWRLLI